MARRPDKNSEAYARHKEQVARREAERARAGRDCAGSVHPPVDPARRQACKRDLRMFCEVYESERYHLKWSPEHLRVIQRLEQCVLDGGQFALAMPRGMGKSTLCVSAAKWAALYGHRQYVAIIAATDPLATNLLAGIKADLESNRLFEEDFSEVVGPIRALEGIAHRCNGQLYNGERTHMHWRSDYIALPYVDDSPASGIVMGVAGLLGQVRGLQHTRQDGTVVRPSLVLLDDPQTDESARSRVQCERRERVLTNAILNLAGPTETIAALMPCTVVVPGDLADNVLDREKHPEWTTERIPMLRSFPKNEELWRQYADIREECLRAEEGLGRATAFYVEHREKMDAGAEATWEERFNHDEASAIQHAMNLKLKDERMFFAEFQNDPLPETDSDEERLSEDDFCLRLNGTQQGMVPVDRTTITAYVDVHKDALLYVVCAWGDGFTGDVIDYGVFPDQARDMRNWRLRDTYPTIADAYAKATGKTAGLEGLLYWAFTEITEKLLGRKWKAVNGAEYQITRLLIDSQWGESTDVVYQFCRETRFSRTVMPASGLGITASSQPWEARKRKKGERHGLHWYIPVPGSRRVIRHVNIDTNYWKTFTNTRLLTAPGDRGALMLFGKDRTRHSRLAEHYLSEIANRVFNETKQRTAVEWKQTPGADNHWWDCLVGCAVGAAMEGVEMAEVKASPRPRKRQQISLAEMQRAKRAAKNAR